MVVQIVRTILKLLYRVEVKGLEHYRNAGQRVLIVANHTSFLDPVLLSVFLPDRLSFAINTQIAENWYSSLAKPFVGLFVLDPMQPFSLRGMIRYVQSGRRVVIFPEGRITVTGSLMKIYHGPGLVADRTGAQVLPVRIEGAQYTPFSRLRGRIKLRLLPRISLTILPPQQITAPQHIRGRLRRLHAGQQISDIMTEMMFATTDYHRSIFSAVVDAMQQHGRKYVIAEDVLRQPMSYQQLLIQAFILGRKIRGCTEPGEYVGVLLPNTTAAVLTFLANLSQQRIPAMLNYTAGAEAVLDACRVANIKTIYTSRQFSQAAHLETLMEALSDRLSLVYLEDLIPQISLLDRIRGRFAARFPNSSYYRSAGKVNPDSPAVLLFTSGAETQPKGVVLSHANIMANMAQLAARIAFSSRDIVFNALPMYQAFGLSAGTLLPLTAGLRTFYYPTPLHYRIIPELVYSSNASIMFGIDSHLMAYANNAHPYDFYNIRYVFAGGEKVRQETRQVWSEKFGVRILEGYGTTETSPVLCANTPMEIKAGTVGKFLPGIRYRIEAVPNFSEGGRLYVKGPSVMLGYLLHTAPGKIDKPQTSLGAGWYDTGDIVSIDEEGFVTVVGRASQLT